MRRMSANNHRGQEGANFHKQAGYMRAMISSHINDQLSCKPEWVHICRVLRRLGTIASAPDLPYLKSGCH
jgi:hypothetical protein